MRWSCRERVEAEEWVDDPRLSLADTLATVREQAVVNRTIGGAQATLAHALPLLEACPHRSVHVLDAACGGADISRHLVDHARRLGRPVSVTALDISTTVLICAQRLSRGYSEISFICADALRPPFRPGTFDLVLLPTFIHHLSPEQVVGLLQVGRELSRGTVVVADLVRSSVAYRLFQIFARLMRFSPVTIHDGLISVCRAYTPAELMALARRAGLERWELYRHPFFRMALVYAGAGPVEGGAP